MIAAERLGTGGPAVEPATRADLLSRFIVGGVLALVLAHLTLTPLMFSTKLHPMGWIATGIVLAAWRMCGPVVLTRTKFDWFFLFWAFLAGVSWMYASEFLGRLIFNYDTDDYVKTIVMSWALYRAGYAVSLLRPRIGSLALILTVLGGCLFAAMLGILQGHGPLQGQALQLGGMIGWPNATLEQAAGVRDTVRPTGLNSAPTALGSLNALGVAIMAAIVIGYRNRLHLGHFVAAVGVTAIFVASTIISQVRAALLLEVIIILVVIGVYAYKRQVQFAALMLLLAAAVAVPIGLHLKDSQTNQLSRFLHTGVKRDESFVVRTSSWQALGEMAPQVAFLGTGWTMMSASANFRKGDYYANANGPDNAYLQVFLNHGVPGVIHFLFLIYCMYILCWEIRPQLKENYAETMRWLMILITITFILNSFFGSRHFRLETFAYIWLFFGAATALAHRHRNRAEKALTAHALRLRPSTSESG
jgi:hypothetical protein